MTEAAAASDFIDMKSNAPIWNNFLKNPLRSVKFCKKILSVNGGTTKGLRGQ